MAIDLQNTEVEFLAEQLAGYTGESKVEAITKALRDRLLRIEQRRSSRCIAGEIEALGKECAALPILDVRTADEIMGYDENGLPQ